MFLYCCTRLCPLSEYAAALAHTWCLSVLLCLQGEQDTIWDPFISNSGSSGLGLFVVKAQASAAGGDCGVHNNPDGAGSVFWFSMPYLTAPIDECLAGTIGLVEGVEAESNEAEPTRDILLIDDTLVVLQLTALEIRQHGLQVDIAVGPEQALEMMLACQYRLVLCDYSMGLTTGADLTLEFRTWEKANRLGSVMNIYALTAHVEESVNQACMESGMQGLFYKPLDDTAVERIRDLVQNSRNTQTSAADPEICVVAPGSLGKKWREKMTGVRSCAEIPGSSLGITTSVATRNPHTQQDLNVEES